MKSKTYLLLAALALQIGAQSVLADDTADAIADLKKQVEALNQKIATLEHNREVDKETAAEKQKTLPTVSAGADGFWIRSADTNFALRVRGYGQFDGRYYASTAPAHDEFLMRRLRLGFEGTVFKYYDFKVLTDFGAGINSTSANDSFLQDAFVNFHYWKEFQVQMGKFKQPVSLETLQSDALLFWVERGFPTQLAPNRDMGVQVQGDLFNNHLSYALGVFNAVPDNGSGDQEVVDNRKDFAGRVFAKPFVTSDISSLQGLALGIAGTFGDYNGTLPNYVTPGRQTFFSYVSGNGSATSPTATANGSSFRIAPQGYWYWKNFGLFGEYVLSSQEVLRRAGPVFNSAQIANGGWNVDLAYVLTGEDETFNTPALGVPFNIKDRTWGAWEVVSRYGELSIDEDAFPLFASAGSAQQISSWGIGLNWYLNRNMKFNFDYEHSWFNLDTSKVNRVTTQDEDVFLGRAQFAF